MGVGVVFEGGCKLVERFKRGRVEGREDANHHQHLATIHQMRGQGHYLSPVYVLDWMVVVGRVGRGDAEEEEEEKGKEERGHEARIDRKRPTVLVLRWIRIVESCIPSTISVHISLLRVLPPPLKLVVELIVNRFLN